MTTDLVARLRKQANMCSSPTTWGEAADYIEQLEAKLSIGALTDEQILRLATKHWITAWMISPPNEHWESPKENVIAFARAIETAGDGLVKALQFYANGKHVKDGIGWDSQPTIEDGEVARAALAKAGAA